MKKSFLLLNASLLMTLSVMAQLPELAGVSQNFSNAPYYLPDSQQVDTTLFVVRYQFSYPRASGSKLVNQVDLLQFEIGKYWNRERKTLLEDKRGLCDGS